MIVPAASVVLTPDQARAVRAIVAWYFGGKSTPQVFYLAGYAGTGKSTIYNVVRQELAARGVYRVVSCAFIAKAAAVLISKGVSDAMTLHAGMYIPEEDEDTGELAFRLNEVGPIAMADLVGLDECSMVNEEMAADALSFGVKVLVMGDPGQLPPVRGAGAFTNREPDFMLTEVHRQALDSPIIRLATWARERKPIPLGDYGSDVRVLLLNRDTYNEVQREDTQVICGTHKVRYTITRMIRDRLGFPGTLPHDGERVMCMKNNRDLGLINGVQGKLLLQPRIVTRGTNEGCYRFNVQMDGASLPHKALTVHPYHFQRHVLPDLKKPRIGMGLCEFDWGYVLTGHKAIGSEFPHVTLVDDSKVFDRDERRDAHKWLYTGLTRASEGLTYLKRAA